MEPQRRAWRAAALASSIVLVGLFIGFASGVFVFLAGSKANPVFQPHSPVRPSEPAAPVR
jgi:hypothetical protein